MRSRYISFTYFLALQISVIAVIVALLSSHPRITFKIANDIKVGMSPSEVEQILGQPYQLAGHTFSPVAVTREDGELKVDAIKITPSFYPIGPGLPSYTLYSRQEEFPTFFGKTNPANRYNFWLTQSCSILVFYGRDERVTNVFALPTTVEPGNPLIRLKWYFTQLLGK